MLRDVGTTLGELTKSQLRNLCRVVGIDADEPVRLLGGVLGAADSRPLSEPPLWPSDVADDATPIEFSVQFDDNGARHLRILAETLPAHPGPAANLRAARNLIDDLADRYDLSLDRLRAVQDLFSGTDPQGKFSWWFSFIFDADGTPKFKMYFNPEVSGAEAAPALVAEAFERLGMADAYRTVSKYALQRGELDRLSFFALDLDHSRQSRVKLYIGHHAAQADDVEFAASAVPGIDPAQVREFCSLLAGDTPVFRGRPLISSYSFVEGDQDKPSNYSLYMPIRDYVRDDAVARERLQRHLRQHRISPALLDEVIAAVTDRELAANAGLLAHVSLRLSPNRTGTTVYVSSEAYGGTHRQAR
ncbi:tryptophan dimethylallyltransferase family protein [Saccharopolyspora phatthalungensis]|uniref:DMATS type aromatic prenyltransferase n=1 Tax=Saccharopolyspora phatthalungensis TaxID=664693 RepID=A0A840QJ78_9PSEU|nr:tryptophan dimethylallyltransferase family protein [Saccharopolyspora phatthalungensis]MBB5157693.1 DMATS type aromatic prenyltransferase [Saccharopolyspora phatthalungensis]